LTIESVTRLAVPGHPIVGMRAANPGPLTLSGTNSWIAGADPAWLIDPGPGLDAHVDALSAEITSRGGLGGIALTHDHPDHQEAVAAMRIRFPQAPLAAARGDADVRLVDGQHFGPLQALATPGHAPDHLAFLFGSAALTGDAVLGEGSVFIAPDPGALAGYLVGLQRLRERGLDVLLPGHGPVITDPQAKLDEYLAHRRQREQRLVQALAAGARSVSEMLAAAWPEVPARLRAAATMTLAAHLDKLAQEGRLPTAVERPVWPSGPALSGG
jgi:glyoxylase-like metal-dependent hydrolase (beta-lactamase superfamily II)